MAAGYVASARIDRARPRLAAASTAMSGSFEAWPPRGPGGGALTADDRFVDAAPVEPGTLELHWTAFRERWSQLWFFVLDPESWR